MKHKLLIISIFFTINSFSQNITKEIISIQSPGKNSKTIVFCEQSSPAHKTFVIKAQNESSKEYTSCKWSVKLGAKKMKELYQLLSDIDIESNSQVSYKRFSIKVKKNKVKITFFDSSCTNEHKTHYFQKSCNRALSFTMQQQQLDKLIKTFNNRL